MRESLIIKAKLLLRAELARQRVSQAELARRLGVSEPRAHDITRLHPGTKIDTLQGAFAALGMELALSVQPATAPPHTGCDNDSIETARSA